MDLEHFLGNQARCINTVSRIGAGFDIGTTACECWHSVYAAYEQKCVPPLPEQLHSSHIMSRSTRYGARSHCDMRTHQRKRAGAKEPWKKTTCEM